MNSLLPKHTSQVLSTSLKHNLLLLGISIGVGITALLLTITFLPGFYPDGYVRLHRAGLVPVIILIAIIQLSASAGWIYASHTNKGDNRE